MKVKKTFKGNVKITLSPAHAEHLRSILNQSSSIRRPTYDTAAVESTSWDLWRALKKPKEATV